MATIKLYETKSGTTLYMVRYRTPEGTQTKKRGFATKREAEAWANRVEVDKMRGAYVAPALGRTSIGALGPAWLARQRGHMKPSGWRSYESAWRIHVAPRWATAAIGDVRRSEVAGWIAELSAVRGPMIVETAASVLRRILDDAVADRLLAVNPATGIRLPRRAPRANVYLTRQQLEALATQAGRYRPLVLLLGTVGLRWGEAAALRVSDVDFLRRRIHLHRNAVVIGKTAHVGTLKSGKNRTVALPGFVVDALAPVCDGKDRGELLWSSATGGYLAPPASTESWLSGAVARCQAADPTFPRVTAHALRHTAASLAISAGANVKVVQRMLGHSSAAMTLDVYADLFDTDLDSVAAQLDLSWQGAGRRTDTSESAQPRRKR
jgi:integrase